jgi:AcrR family transcriptional regulator
MAKRRVTSKFRQIRSTSTKQKIVEAAEDFFCQNGYYGSSVQKLAASANVSIGSFYFYFKDKDELLLEVYKKQGDRFIQTIEESLGKTERYREDRKAWLREFIRDILKTYGNSGKLRFELKALNYENPQIALQRNVIRERTLVLMLESFERCPMVNDLKVRNPRTALLLTIDLMDSVYDRLSCENPTDDWEDILEEYVDAIYKYLFL